MLDFVVQGRAKNYKYKDVRMWYSIAKYQVILKKPKQLNPTILTAQLYEFANRYSISIASLIISDNIMYVHMNFLMNVAAGQEISNNPVIF